MKKVRNAIAAQAVAFGIYYLIVSLVLIRNGGKWSFLSPAWFMPVGMVISLLFSEIFVYIAKDYIRTDYHDIYMEFYISNPYAKSNFDYWKFASSRKYNEKPDIVTLKKYYKYSFALFFLIPSCPLLSLLTVGFFVR